MLPLAILFLGIAGIAFFMAARPWPMPQADKPVKPGAYLIQILQGNPPAASNPPDRAAEVTTIQAGLAAALAVWVASKLAGMITGILPSGGGTIGGDVSGSGEDVSGPGEAPPPVEEPPPVIEPPVIP